MMTKRLLPALAAALFTAAPTVSAAPTFADLVFVVDESGSMSGEHAWLGTMSGGLESRLVADGLTPNQWGLTGFGASAAHGVPGHKHNVGIGEFGTAAEFATATGTLVISGATEDGWQALTFAANNYSYRAGSARNLILVTDEDRDASTAGAGITRDSTESAIAQIDGILNVVVNASIRCGDQSVALGMTAGGIGYKADGLGGYTTCAGATAVSGSGFTVSNYVELALNLGGAAWDLNQLRAGGATAQSFTAAFVDIKVQEIVNVSEPATLALIGLGLLGAFVSRRRFAAA